MAKRRRDFFARAPWWLHESSAAFLLPLVSVLLLGGVLRAVTGGLSYVAPS